MSASAVQDRAFASLYRDLARAGWSAADIARGYRASEERVRALIHADQLTGKVA